MKIRRVAFFATVAVISFILVATASATTTTVVFSSFGPGNTYNTGVAWGVTGASTSSGYRAQAEFFVPSASGTLSSFTLATHRQTGSGLSNFYIAADNGSGIPGTILESFLNTANNNNGLLTLPSVTQPALQAGTRYWLCDEPADSTTANGWFESQTQTGGFAFERSPWSWDFVSSPVPSSGVFSVSVIQAPEPAAVYLLPGALLLITRCARRRGA